jgi:Arc/MetJ-type ribon-helix-helix transcriptional regulator
MAGQIQVQLRVPKETVKGIDSMVKTGRFKSRSDAIKSMINAFEEREKTRKFFEMLIERSNEASGHPEKLIPFSEI